MTLRPGGAAAKKTNKRKTKTENEGNGSPMNRREILQRRKYAAIPKATLARGDLTPAGKIVYTCLIGELFSDVADRAELSTADIAAGTALSRRTVRAAIRDLEAAGLVASHQSPGVASAYTFPSADGGGPPRQNLPTTPAKSAGVSAGQPRQILPTTPAKSAGPPEKSADPRKEENGFERFLEHPPLPPRGGGPERTGPDDSGENGDGKNRAVAAVAAAHIEATGRPMPRRWTERIGREIDGGNLAIVEEIDAAAIREAMAFAEKRNIAFAWGTVLLSIRQKPRRDVARRVAQRGRAAADRPARIAAAHAAELAGRRAEALKYFRRLGPDERARWIERAKAMPGIDRCGVDGVEAVAATRAFDARAESKIESERRLA